MLNQALGLECIVCLSLLLQCLFKGIPHIHKVNSKVMRRVKARIHRDHKEIISMMVMEMGVLMEDLVMVVMGARILIKGQVTTILTVEETMEEATTSGLTLETDFVLLSLMIMGKVINLVGLKIIPVEASKLTSGPKIRTTSLVYLECQICSRRGHTSPNCYFRTDSGQLFGGFVVCQICGKKGHIALECFHKNNFSYQGAPPPASITGVTA